MDFDDSMSTKLLPGEKPRTKKDIGTTSYKKPGPPTPSKNGGRLSLQGSEVHPRDALRDHNTDAKTPKRTTPSRLKALFMGRNSAMRDNSEVWFPMYLEGMITGSLIPKLNRCSCYCHKCKSAPAFYTKYREKCGLEYCQHKYVLCEGIIRRYIWLCVKHFSIIILISIMAATCSRIC